MPVNHHLYADDTQLYISFRPTHFSDAQSSIQNKIALLSSWMASNFLSLNPSKTEFLLIGLPQQLAKIHQPVLVLPDNNTVTPVTTARNLGIIFDSNLSFKQHLNSLTKICHYHCGDLRRIRPTLDSEIPVSSPQHLSTPNLTTATHFSISCLRHSLIVLRSFKTH